MGTLCSRPNSDAVLLRPSDDGRGYDESSCVTQQDPVPVSGYSAGGGGGGAADDFGGHNQSGKGKAILQQNRFLDLHDCAKFGVLLKRSKYKNEWVPRFIVLKGSLLFSCRKEGEEPNLVLLLEHNTQLSRSGAHASWSSKQQEQAHTFTVSDSQGQSWPLAFTSDDELESWWLALKEQIDCSQLRREYANELQQMIIDGHTFKKYHHSRFGALAANKRSVDRVVRVDDECTMVFWLKEGSDEYSDIPIRDITRLVSGAETPAFKGTTAMPGRCFSVISDKRTLDLEAESSAVRDAWVKGLTGLIRFGHITTERELEAQADAMAMEAAQLKADQKVKQRRASRAKLKAMVAANTQEPSGAARSYKSSAAKNTKFAKLGF